MQFGASMFFTDYSMTPASLGRALEDRGFESVWAPEHSHIPVARKTPWGGGGESFTGRPLWPVGRPECLESGLKRDVTVC